MTMPTNAERRPQSTGTAFAPHQSAATNGQVHTASLPDAADLLEGVHVLVVAVDHPDGPRYRRRFMLSLDSAQKAADRAVMRGHRASIVLARVAPVETIARWEA